MKNKLIKLIITTLLITLTILSIFTYKSYRTKQTDTYQIINKTQQEQTFRVIDKQTIINKLNNTNSINILDGNINTKATFSNQNITQSDVSMRWIKTKLSELNSKDISVESHFDFMFSYSLNDLPIQIYNNSINITLSYNRLSLTKCELSSTQSKERVGLLTSQFTPTEVNGINYRTQQLARNSILSNEDLRYRCLENVQGDIKDLLQGAVGKDTDIHFDVLENSNVVQQDDLQIIK